MWGWSAFTWRWISKRRQRLPKLFISFLGISTLATFVNISNGNLFAVPGVHDNYFTLSTSVIRDELNHRKIKTLAQRKAKLAEERAEADAYLAVNGHTPHSTNEFVQLKDYQAY